MTAALRLRLLDAESLVVACTRLRRPGRAGRPVGPEEHGERSFSARGEATVDRPWTPASLSYPSGVVVAGHGDLVIADEGHSRARRAAR